ncbi:MAG: hypothetical protein Q9N34_09215 [Aquificota bacterium]|nr:hypothetical protein [Aquificota bacterium]
MKIPLLPNHFTDAQRLLGAYQAWQGFVNEYFGGDSTAAARWMEAYSLLRTRGDLKAFENYIHEQGLDKYVGTRYGELLNETAKMQMLFEAAKALGMDPLEFFKSKHAKIHTTLRSEEEVLGFASLLEKSGMKDKAEKLRENPDEYVGSSEFCLYPGREN